MGLAGSSAALVAAELSLTAPAGEGEGDETTFDAAGAVKASVVDTETVICGFSKGIGVYALPLMWMVQFLRVELPGRPSCSRSIGFKPKTHF